jgi:hypothetical protein
MRVLRISFLALLAGSMIATSASATVITISGPASVNDNVMRSDDPNANIGQNPNDKTTRMFPDVNFTGGVQRHWLVKFDLSSIPAGQTITNAKYGIYVRRNNGLTVDTITGYKISRLKSGKSWLEGTNDFASPAFAGDSTWNSQAHGSTLWGAPGATGAADIDTGASQVSWDLPGGNTDPGFIEFDLTTMVQDWYSGAWQNNGLVHWGGTAANPVTDNQRYNWTYDSDTNTVPARVPYLIVTYTPEPTAGLLLVAGSLPLLLRRKRLA